MRGCAVVRDSLHHQKGRGTISSGLVVAFACDARGREAEVLVERKCEVRDVFGVCRGIRITFVELRKLIPLLVLREHGLQTAFALVAANPTSPLRRPDKRITVANHLSSNNQFTPTGLKVTVVLVVAFQRIWHGEPWPWRSTCAWKCRLGKHLDSWLLSKWLLSSWFLSRGIDCRRWWRMQWWWCLFNDWNIGMNTNRR